MENGGGKCGYIYGVNQNGVEHHNPLYGYIYGLLMYVDVNQQGLKVEVAWSPWGISFTKASKLKWETEVARHTLGNFLYQGLEQIAQHETWSGS